jgi:hypothetical protein
MSLIIKVTLSKQDQMTSKEVKSIQAEGSHITASLHAPLFARTGTDINLNDTENEILTDDADPDAET